MKTFDDLQFIQTMNRKEHGRDCWHAECDLGRGLEFSAVYGEGTYSEVNDDGDPTSYEIAVKFGYDMVPLQSFEDVLGWQSPDHINKIMMDIQLDKDFVKDKVDAKHNSS